MEWICLGCNTVFHTNNNSYNHCKGKEIVPFNPNEHAELLIGSSNSWNAIANKWDAHPIYKKVLDEHINNGSYGAARILSDFVDRLIEMVG